MSHLVANIVAFTLYTISSSAGLILMKSSFEGATAAFTSGRYMDRAELLLALGAVLYISSFALWIGILNRNPLSVAYPIAIGLSLAVSTAGSFWLLQEDVTLQRLLGIMLVLAGVVVVAQSSR